MATHKVFVGQLDFQTTEQELHDLFAEAGAVAKATVITRGGRSLGYGFVEFESESDSAAAVEKFNQTSWKDRTLKVEVARPQTAAAAAPRRRFPRKPRYPREDGAPAPRAVPARAPAPHGGPARAPPPRTAGAPAPVQSRPPPRTHGYNNAPTGYPTRPYRRPQNYNPEYENNYYENPAPARRFDNRRRPRPATDAHQPPAAAPPSGAAAPAPRAPRTRRPENTTPPAPKIVSQTAVFVANLPFSVTDEGLTKIFEDFHPKNAHVVKTRNGRSRGYGFVDFETQADQSKAIEAKNQTLVQDDRSTAEKPREPRKIMVTISYSAPEQQQN
eukprot:TRINITY_DN428_c0_g1_i1.p1 TRINITY_DN428_c0_g1~~TRINITY_DN428_c0_g1_i1.p1  ORF type:complete len:329 (+),score=24.08 TRINITY_DN428_c0_g1_i1:1155-2141(+)